MQFRQGNFMECHPSTAFFFAAEGRLHFYPAKWCGY